VPLSLLVGQWQTFSPQVSSLERSPAARPWGPRSPHFGQVKTGEEMCLSDLIWCSMVSRESRSSTSAANDMVSRHSLRNLASISGNQTFWASPFGMEKTTPSSIYWRHSRITPLRMFAEPSASTAAQA
jgi:hypothetical protein